jgi:signal transduction histidine kinase
MSKEKISVLYLDDEEHNLISFRAAFRRDFEVFVTTKPAEAAEMLASNDIQIIIADQKMPEISGTEFLELIKTEHPDPIRLLLTGYADIQAVIDAINKGQIYRYISKPWNEQDLKLIIENAHDYYTAKRGLKVSNRELQQALTNLESVVYCASQELNTPMASIRGVLDSLQNENDTAIRKPFISHIENAVLKLELFANNLLNYNRNSSTPVVAELFNVKQLLEELLLGLASFKTAYGVSFSLAFSGEPEIISDQMRIKIAIQNLLVNAIEEAQTESDSRVVELQAENRGKVFVLRYNEKGWALPEKKMERLKVMFSGNSYSDTECGLGAHLLREVLYKIQGKAEISSSSAEGTAIQLTIPLHVGA